jgi:hypothetical protein
MVGEQLEEDSNLHGTELERVGQSFLEKLERAHRENLEIAGRVVELVSYKPSCKMPRKRFVCSGRRRNHLGLNQPITLPRVKTRLIRALRRCPHGHGGSFGGKGVRGRW